jgi:hypothetical protein
MTRRILFIFAIAVFVACFSACGYRFAGSGSYPAGIRQIFVTVLENRTAETGVETLFTNDLIYEFTRSRKESLARERSSADGILSGTIVALSVSGINRTSVSTSVERRVTGTLVLRLESPDGRLLWASGNIVESEAYAVAAGDKMGTERNKSKAIATLSRKLAESAFNRLTENF